MAMATDDWVDVADEFCCADEWILLAGDEGSMSAVFFGRAAAGIGGGAAPPIAVTGPAAAVAACRSRVLLRGAWSQYYVLDPSSGECHALPRPRRPRSYAAVLFDAAIACDAKDKYSVVCAYDGLFEIYASASGEWREVPAATAAGVAPGSAASFAGCVFWKTAASPGVLALDVASGTTRQIAPPLGASDHAVHWQLGVAAGQLCAAVSTEDALELYSFAAGDEWKLLHTVGIAMDKLFVGAHSITLEGGCRGARPRPLRFESDSHEVLLRVGGRVVAFDIAGGIAREARLEGAVLPGRDEDFVPWCRAVSTVFL